MPPKKGKGKGKAKQEEEDAIRLSYEPQATKRFEKLFAIYDPDETDSIKDDDFNFFVRALGLYPSNAKLKELAAQCRDDETQAYYTRAKLVEVLRPLLIETFVNPTHELSAPSEEQLILALQSLDSQHQGHLTDGEFRTALSGGGERFDPEELEDAVAAAIYGDSGVVEIEKYAGKLLYDDKLF